MGKKGSYVKRMNAVTAVFTNTDDFKRRAEQELYYAQHPEERPLEGSAFIREFIREESYKREILSEKPRKSSTAPRARTKRRRS
jgi:hypothetical protein